MSERLDFFELMEFRGKHAVSRRKTDGTKARKWRDFLRGVFQNTEENHPEQNICSDGIVNVHYL